MTNADPVSAYVPHSTAPGTAIRRAASADVPPIKTMIAAAYTKYIERIGKMPAPMLADYSALMCDDDVFLYVLVADAQTQQLSKQEQQQLLGSIVLRVPDAARASGGEARLAVQVNNLVVDEAAQGRGYGRALLRCAEDLARVHGRSALELYTNVKMIENLGLYAKMGFDEVDRRQSDGYERVFFRKELPP